jgi:hypothetical protein
MIGDIPSPSLIGEMLIGCHYGDIPQSSIRLGEIGSPGCSAGDISGPGLTDDQML